MPIYEFQCLDHSDLVFTAKTTQPETCPHASPNFKRLWAFQGIKKGWGGGMAPAVGGYVSNEHEFQEKLKAASHAASEELGMEHRFKMIDPRDMAALGGTGE